MGRAGALRALLFLSCFSGLFGPFGCAANFEPRTPMPQIAYPVPGARRAATLIVFLPGRRDHASVFARNGLIEVVQRANLGADLIATDAHIGYYRSGSLVRQLHDEIIEPAHARGYRRIILIGVSMGAYGAVRYAMAHPGKVDVLVLLSPFLGAGPVGREIAEAGDEDFEQTRRWLLSYPKSKSDAERSAAQYPRILFGRGEEDLFPITHAELRAALPPHDVFTTPGAHVWPTWRALLEKMLQRKVLTAPSSQEPSR